MTATKQPRRTQRNGETIIAPSPYNRGGVTVITDLEKAKEEAMHHANLRDQHRYVISVDGGYVVMGYADLWDYFGDDMEEETVFKVDAPGTSRGRKWPGE